MILAGIDEAGYGPLLGPLVVGCCAFSVEHPAEADLPCLWKRLRRSVGKTRSKSGRKLHVNDSKLVYAPASGLKELERSVLALVNTTASGWPATLDDFLAHTARHAVEDLAEHPWYAAVPEETFPLEQSPATVRVLSNGVREEMRTSATPCVYAAARVVPERQFNRMVGQTRNKAGALFSIAAVHLDHLLRTYGRDGLTIFCDRQGGRGYYGPLLRLMFPDWSLKIVAEADGRSEYRLRQDGGSEGDRGGGKGGGKGGDVRLIFCEKAELQCLPVAVASMLSKYLRESLMHRFNRYWVSHVPGLKPTAGYYGDGQRFLADIDAKRREMGITDEELVRCR